MNNAFLKSISVSNFGPFKDEIYFTTEVDNGKKEFLEKNTFEAKEHRYNKVSYIYGANAAGKSNFCKAVIQIQKLIMLSPIIASNNPQLLELKPFKDEVNAEINYFKFSKDCDKKPTSFGIEIIIDDILYNYSFEICNGKVVKEILTKKNKRTETILIRTSEKYEHITLKSELATFKYNITVVKENVLCLSMAAFLNNELANKLVTAINDIKVLNMSSISGLRNFNQDEYNQEKIDDYLEILKIAEPTITNLEVSFTESKVEKQKVGADDFENRELIIKNISIDVKSTHNVYENRRIVDEVELPFLKIESNGTIKMFNIVPIISNVLSSGGILIIDEIESGLHPNLVNMLINFFYDDKINKFNAQLICTTHNTTLIENGIRRDQIWFVNKDECGESDILRLSNILKEKNLNVRGGENIVQRYLEGAFGGIPNLS